MYLMSNTGEEKNSPLSSNRTGRGADRKTLQVLQEHELIPCRLRWASQHVLVGLAKDQFLNAAVDCQQFA
jgi:hypothetical protein